MDLPSLMEELRHHGARLLDRHLHAARDWYPHEFVPWSKGRDYVESEEWDGREWSGDPRVRSALILNVLTEDGLPYYVAGIHELVGDLSPWFDWLRRWTAEEMRHAMAIRDYIVVTRAVDPRQLEQLRMRYCSEAAIPRAPNPLEAFIYLAMQELATRLAHWRTGELLPEEAGQRLMRRVATDENLHHLFYRDLVAAALEIAPSAVTIAIDNQIRHFKMPGHGVPQFAELTADVSAAGIYSVGDFIDEIVDPLVSTHWAPRNGSRLSPAAEQAHRRTVDFVHRLRRLAGRL